MPDVANTIAQQMGGLNRIEAMLGAKYVMAIDDGLAIRWPGKPANHVEIVLQPDDTYSMQFYNIRGTSVKKLKRFDDVYADQLVPIFERYTGFRLSL